ncbi:MAG TPA: lipoprotein-releasing ABC transporter permease subunit [Caulobacterales bacterium]|jgi:lipoprotein-releasing system permease protein|nr:lipoprotein-releasing ABC transporter permease subunit [Caulobacterales bacterium]
MAGAAPPFGRFERALASRYLRSRRAQGGGAALISIISVLAIAAAVFVLITTMSIMNGFREQLLSRILGVKGHVYVQLENQPADDIPRLIALAKGAPGVLHVTPLVEGQALATANGQAMGALVRGVSAEDIRALTIVDRSLQPGALARYGTDSEGFTHILIGYRLAEALGVDRDNPVSLISPQGSVTPFGLTPRRKVYDIASTFKIDMYEFDSALIYMPLDEAELFFSRSHPDKLELRVANPDDTDAVMRALRARMPADVFIYDWRAENQAIADALVVERNMMALILGLIVLIAALNIISALVMLVKNKSRDIAILRTMGATQNAVMRIFMMSGATLGALGTGVGLALGTLFCLYIGPIQDMVSMVFGIDVFHAEVYSFRHIPAKVHWNEVAIVGAWAFAMSILVTLPPSIRASRLDPVEALRYE